MICGPLCDFEDLNASSDIDLSPWEESVAGLIAAASQAVADFAGREFRPVSDGSATRTFIVPESPGWPRRVVVGDLAGLEGLEVTSPGGTITLVAQIPGDVTGHPLNRDGSEPITELELGPALPYSAGSAVQVTGVWGWPSVPEVVRLATLDTVRGWLKMGFLANLPGRGEEDTGAAAGLSVMAMRLLRPYRQVPLA